MTIKHPIEKDEELLKKYGLASALFSSTDYLLGEMIRFNGDLNKANQDLVNEILDKKTFGYKVNISRHLITDKELLAKLHSGVEDRNMLAHGVSVLQNNELKLMHSKNIYNLDVDTLDKIIDRTRILADDIIKEIKKKYKLL